MCLLSPPTLQISESAPIKLDHIEFLKSLYLYIRTDRRAKALGKIRSPALEPRVRLEAFCHAAIDGERHVADLLLHRGFDRSTESGHSARDEVIQMLKSPVAGSALIHREVFVRKGRGSSEHFSVRGWEGTFVIVRLPIGDRKVVEVCLLSRAEEVRKFAPLQSLLRDAIRKTDLAAISFLLKHGVDIKQVYQEGFLLSAIKRRQKKIAEMLLDNGAKVEPTDMLSLSGFFKNKRNWKFLPMFAHYGANFTLLHMRFSRDSTQLHDFAHWGCVRGCEWFLRNGEDVNGTNFWGETALSVALQAKHFHVAEFLIEYGASVDHEDKHGRTPLIQAAASGNEDAVEFLLNLNEMKTSGLVERGGSQKCPFGCDAWLSRDDADYLRRAKKSIAETHGSCVVKDGGDGTIKSTSETIENCGANLDLDNCVRKPTFPPLTHRATSGSKNGLNNLTFETSFKSDTDLDHDGNVKERAVETTEKCAVDFDRGRARKPSSETTFKSDTNLDSCVNNFTSETIIKCGANFDRIRKPTSETTGDNTNRDRRLKNRIHHTKISNQPRVNINARDNIGRTALILAVNKQHPEVVEILLKYGADVNLSTRLGETALLQAIEKADKAIFTTLLAHGADLDTVNCHTFTELSSAALYVKSSSPPLYYKLKNESILGRQDIVRALLSRGLDLGRLIGSPGQGCASVYQAPVLQVALEFGLLRDFSSLLRLRCIIDILDQEPYRYVALLSRAELINLLAEHIVKLSAAGLLTLPQQHCFFDDLTVDIEEFRGRCEAEVARMGDVIPGSGVTYYQVLRKDVDQLALMSGNESVVQVLQAAEQEFPLYAGMLLGRLERGLQRRKLVQAATRVCQRIFRAHSLPYEMTEMVVTRLDDADLRRFLNGVKGDHVLKSFVEENYRASGDSKDSSPRADGA